MYINYRRKPIPRTLWGELRCDLETLFVLTLTGLFYIVASAGFIAFLFGMALVGLSFG